MDPMDRYKECDRARKKREFFQPNHDFESFPDEIMLHIFRFLSLPDLANSLWSIGNKRIRQLCRDYSLCSSVRISRDWDLDTVRDILLMAGDNLKKLSLPLAKKDRNNDDNNNNIDVLVIQALEKSNSSLEWLLLEDDDVSAAVLSAIGSSSSLRKLSLGTTWLSTQEFSVIIDPWIFKGRSSPLTSTLITHLSCFKNITCIDLQWAHLVDNDREGRLVRALADACGSGRLERVALPLLTFQTDAAVTYLLERVNKTITHLSLGYSPSLTDVSYSQLRNCRRLEKLVIFFARRLRAGGLSAVAELLSSSSKLQELTIVYGWFNGGEFAEAFGGGGRSMNCLRELNLADCTRLDDDGIEAMVMGSPNLERVCLTGCYRIGDRGVTAVLRQCKDLKGLKVSNTNVTEKAFSGVGGGGGGNSMGGNLRRLEISDNMGVDFSKAMPMCKVYVKKNFLGEFGHLQPWSF